MELRKLQEATWTPQQQKKRQEEESIRQDAAKTYGKYVINMTNICFDKCTDLSNLYHSRTEKDCLQTCFLKFKDLNHYTLEKFIKADFNPNISENYIESPFDLLK
jgi:hypothetical protein